MLIAGFNCNPITTGTPVSQKCLNDMSPDVLSLQETRVSDKEFPADEITSIYIAPWLMEKPSDYIPGLAELKI